MIQLPIDLLGRAIAILAAMAGFVLAVWIVVRLLAMLLAGVGIAFKGVGHLIAHVFECLKGIVVSALRYTGSILTAVVFLPMVLFSIVLGRWSAATHYGRAAGEELRDAALSLYRCGLGYPLRLIGLGGLVASFEQRIPEVIARAPGADRPRGGAASFEGYEVVGSLPPGGSGAKLYLATATDQKAAQLAQAGVRCPDKVVIKAFSIESGSTVPQMMREGRALEAARDLGLVLEHSTDDGGRFHYVMPFVPGEDLGQVTRGLHAASGTDGLNDTALRAAVGYSSGLLAILSRFHRAGLWHKDIKPNNIIVSGDSVELVDLGLVTPLASAMTLTTHGTEYYRDPELVRLAMQGVKVQDVDGVKFDLYSAGAVLYNLVENEFPAHGSLSKITRRCPDALRWIIRRSMADLRSRYSSAEEMHGDLRALLASDDPFSVKPAQLPSMGGAAAPEDFDAVAESSLAADGPEPLRPVMPGANGGATPPADKAKFAADTPQNKRRSKKGAKKAKKVRAPMGAMAFVGMTLAVLLIPIGLAGMLFTAGSVRSEHAHYESKRATANALAHSALGHNAAVQSMLAEKRRAFPGAFPRPPYAPTPFDSDLPHLPDAPAMPPAVQEAMLGASLDGIADPDGWRHAAKDLYDATDDWVEDVEDAIDHHVLRDLEKWTRELDRWADDVDAWVDRIDGIGQAEAREIAALVTAEHANEYQWEQELAEAHELWSGEGDFWFGEGEFWSGEGEFWSGESEPACEPTDAQACVDGVAVVARPRVLAIAQRRHQIPPDVAERQNRLLVNQLGWDVVSEDLAGRHGADESLIGLIARARAEATFSAIDDLESNNDLGEMVFHEFDGDFDAILRWTFDRQSGIRSHLIVRDREVGRALERALLDGQRSVHGRR